jgi:hypothetical protein
VDVPLFADNLHQHAFPPPPIELAVEDLFPRAEIELAARLISGASTN